MLFNSLPFAAFLPVVFVLYWAAQRSDLRVQNILILVASYVFYGWWDYRFLALIVLSSTIDYVVGRALSRSTGAARRRTLLSFSVLTNLGLLGTFKYFNFFVDSLRDLFVAVGLPSPGWTLDVVLPVGISFYTFQTLSYTIDVYRGRLSATDDPIAFFAFVSFFPQLVAGPIERAEHLLPQFLAPRRFDSTAASDGARQMLWGLFKKIVVADNLALYVQNAFSQAGSAGRIDLIAGVVFFAIQIYCDFSGYSDIAIGSARLFGFSLRRNFAYPYFARDIAEFWRRWHISLSTWFRDYVYIPLGGSKSNTRRRLINVMITFGLSGLWHGANWTFVIWGLLNALYYVPLMVSGTHRANVGPVAPGKLLPSAREVLAMTMTFLLTLVAWVFFRAASLHDAMDYFAYLARPTPTIDVIPLAGLLRGALLSAAIVLPEWLHREKEHAMAVDGLPVAGRWVLYLAVGLSILVLGNFGEVQFIYFQF